MHISLTSMLAHANIVDPSGNYLPGITRDEVVYDHEHQQAYRKSKFGDESSESDARYANLNSHGTAAALQNSGHPENLQSSLEALAAYAIISASSSSSSPTVPNHLTLSENGLPRVSHGVQTPISRTSPLESPSIIPLDARMPTKNSHSLILPSETTFQPQSAASLSLPQTSPAILPASMISESPIPERPARITRSASSSSSVSLSMTASPSTRSQVSRRKQHQAQPTAQQFQQQQQQQQTEGNQVSSPTSSDEKQTSDDSSDESSAGKRKRKRSSGEVDSDPNCRVRDNFENSELWHRLLSITRTTEFRIESRRLGINSKEMDLLKKQRKRNRNKHAAQKCRNIRAEERKMLLDENKAVNKQLAIFQERCALLHNQNAMLLAENNELRSRLGLMPLSMSQLQLSPLAGFEQEMGSMLNNMANSGPNTSTSRTNHATNIISSAKASSSTGNSLLNAVATATARE